MIPPGWRLVPAGERCSLADCPIGMFVSARGSLCLKTEYGNNEGRIDAYIVESGEFFWGDEPQTIASQRQQMVQPLSASPPSPEVGDETVERMARAHYERRGNPPPSFARNLMWATWDQACLISGFRDEQIAAMRAALTALSEPT